ncbi:MAG: hypothetical protein AAGH38_01550 [Pseudomonadota bacterium]
MRISKRLAIPVISGLVAVITVFSPSITLAQGDENLNLNMVISSDGEVYAEIRDVQGKQAVVLYSASNGNEPPKAYAIGDLEVEEILWADKETLLIYGRGRQIQQNLRTGLETLQLERWLTLSRETGEFGVVDVGPGFGAQYTFYTVGSGQLLATTPDVIGDAIFAGPDVKINAVTSSRLAPKADEIRYSVFKANLKRSSKSRVVRGNENTAGWVANAKGDVVARLNLLPTESIEALYVRPNGKGSFERAATFPLKEDGSRTARVVGVTPDSQRLQVWGYDNGNGATLRAFDMETKEFVGSLVPDDIQPLGWTYDFGRATTDAVVYRAGAMPAYYYLDEDLRKLHTRLESALGNTPVRITSRSLDGTKTILRALKMNEPDEFYLYDQTAGALDLIGTSQSSAN